VIASKVVKCAFGACGHEGLVGEGYERGDGGAVGGRSRGVGWVVSGLLNYMSSGQEVISSVKSGVYLKIF
jgi:hypothetical protein